MTGNMRIWDAVSKTDPKHTKKVTFGRTFTSIDAHWQIQQATSQFGPIGEGWGYSVEHSIITLTPEMILAVADVTIWWNGGALGGDPQPSYGPIRGTCEIYGPKTSGGKPIPGMFVTDEDAPKKAMTDALTKGLSHLGFSADVFLGLFDDNRYVQKMEKEFAGQRPPSGGVDMVQEALNDGLATGTQSTYAVTKLKTAIANGWKSLNKTPVGRVDQALDYIDIARNPDDVAKILASNAEDIEASLKGPDVHEAANRLLRWFEEEAAKAVGA